MPARPVSQSAFVVYSIRNSRGIKKRWSSRRNAPPKKIARPAAALAAAIQRAPELSAPKAARARVDEWLGEIARTAAGKALKQLLAPSKQAKLGDLVAAIAEASPYLWDLIRLDPARFLGILDAEPEARFAARAGGGAPRRERPQAMPTRCANCAARKPRPLLLIALADIGGVWAIERVTHALTEFADAALGAAVRYLMRGAVASGKLKVRDPEKPEAGQRLRRPCHGQDGRVRAQLFERYRPDRALRRRCVRARRDRAGARSSFA